MQQTAQQTYSVFVVSLYAMTHNSRYQAIAFTFLYKEVPHGCNQRG